MATQIKVKRTRDRDEKIVYLSRQEAVGLIQNLIVLLTDPIGGGVTNMMVYCEDPKATPYRLFLIPRRPETPQHKVNVTVSGVCVEADSEAEAIALTKAVKARARAKKGKKVGIRKYRRRT